MILKTPVKAGFSLLEVMVAVTVFALVVAAGGGIFVSLQQAWRRQKATISLTQNVRWAMEFMSNEIRHATVSGNPAWARIQPLAGGTQLSFGKDPNADNNPPWQQIQYRRQGAVLQRRWRQRQPNTAWSLWQNTELANFIAVPNPDLVDNNTGLPPSDGIADPIFIVNNGLVTIELTLRPRPAAPIGRENRNYTVITQVRPRN